LAVESLAGGAAAATAGTVRASTADRAEKTIAAAAAAAYVRVYSGDRKNRRPQQMPTHVEKNS
jgi:hypothetical protein